MATSKGGGSVKNGRDSAGQRLGCKAFGGMTVTSGSILVRQHGTNFKPGLNVGLAKDHSLFAKIDGKVRFEGSVAGRRKISVLPAVKA
jgi:large subunit ribosomal protein L27